MNSVYVFGHKNPDTDSVAAAIAYADLKRQLTGGKYVPARLGDVNSETKFVLDYFKIPVPLLLENVYTQLTDIPFEEPVCFTKDAPISEVWSAMMKHGTKTAIVVDENNRFLGIASLGDIARANLEISNDFSNFIVPMENIINTLGGKAVHLASNFFSGKLAVAAMDIEDVKKRISQETLLIVGNREDVLYAAVQKRINTIVVTGNGSVPYAVLNLAKANGVNLIKVPHDTFSTVKLINQSIPVHYVMKSKGLITFGIREYMDDVKDTMLRYKYRYFPILEDRKPVGMLTRRHVLDFMGKKVILVDHNEKSQSVEGLEQAQILEVIDHHRIGNMETAMPIIFINKPVGSTCTIIYGLYRENSIVPSAPIAGIMCAAILSDTLIFKSPTCTSEDIRAAKELAELAGIDLYEFAKAMFEAGTSLKGKSEEEIFYMDFKEFNIGGYQIGVSQVNIYNTDLERLKESFCPSWKG